MDGFACGGVCAMCADTMLYLLLTRESLAMFRSCRRAAVLGLG